METTTGGGRQATPAGTDWGVHPRPPTPAEPGRAGRRWQPSNLTLRLMTAAVLIPPVLWVCYRGGLWFVAVIITLSCIGINEFYGFISVKGANPQRLLGTLAAAFIPVIVYIGDAFWATSFLTAVLLTTMILQLNRREMHEAIASVSATFFGVFYVGWLLSHAVSIRFIDSFLLARYPAAASQVHPEVGFFLMLLCLAAALGCDTGAYFVGRAFGRHRLAPNISPGKTIEGAVGGVVAGGLLAGGMKLLFDYVVPGRLSRGFSVTTAAIFGFVLATVGISIASIRSSSPSRSCPTCSSPTTTSS